MSNPPTAAGPTAANGSHPSDSRAGPASGIPAQQGPGPAVRLTEDGRLLIQTWATRDVDVIAAATGAQQRGQDLTVWLASMLRVGVISSTAAGGTAVLDGVERAVSALTDSLTVQVEASINRLDQRVQATVDPATGPLAVSVQRGIDRLAAGVAEHFIGDTAKVPAAIRESTDQVLSNRLGGTVEDVHRALETHAQTLRATTADDRAQLRAGLLEVIQRQDHDLLASVAELRQTLHRQQVEDAATQAAISAVSRVGSAKGATYEQALCQAVSRVSSAAGDGPSDAVGTSTAADGSRAGDVLTHLTSLGEPTRLLVWEAKDRPGSPVGVSAFRDGLNRARTARAGRSPAVTIGVCPTEQLPGAGTTPLVMLDPGSFLLGWSPDDDDTLLTAAYHLARFAASLQGASHRGDIDTAAVDRGLKDLLTRLAPLSQVVGEASKVNRSSAKIADLAHAMLADLQERIRELRQQLTEPERSATD